MKPAILVPYMIDQNEPSRPVGVVMLPEDASALDARMKELFRQHVNDGMVYGGDEPEPAEDFDVAVRAGTEDDYGDVIAEYDGMFLFATYTELPF